MKNVRIILWGLIAVALVGIVVAKVAIPRPQPPPLEGLFATPTLALIDQDGKPFSTGQLRGRPWVADFIFTSCAGSCPIMSHEMSQVQGKTPAEVDLVSFTVDPDTDKPAILKQYGQALHADFSRWHFLTGTRQEMTDAARQMKIAVHAADKDFALSHSDRFLLIDPAGNAVGVYDGTNSQEVDRLIADAARLAALNRGKSS